MYTHMCVCIYIYIYIYIHVFIDKDGSGYCTFIRDAEHLAYPEGFKGP